MGDYETASAFDSTMEDASAYTSQSTVEPLLENKETSKTNVYVAVGVGLAVVVVLVIAVLLFTGSSSPSAEHAVGKGDEDSDATNRPQSYVVNKRPTENTTANATTTTKRKTRSTLSTTKKTTVRTPKMKTKMSEKTTRATKTSKKPVIPRQTKPTTKATTKPKKTTTTATTTKATTKKTKPTTKATAKPKKTTTTTTKKATTKKTTSTSTTSTTTTTTQRPIPPNTLVCTYGPAITATSPFPKDGVCDYTILEQMPASRAKDFGEPYPSEVKHFIDTAARHRKTEFGVAFDYEIRSSTAMASKDPSMKERLHTLFTKRIFHYGYINTNTFEFNKKEMVQLLHILKRLTSYLEDRKTPQRPIYTIMASTWTPYYNEISASNVAEAFRTVLMPDLFISKVHLYDKDGEFEDCRILPANLLRQPEHLKSNNVYFFNLFTALKHASDLDKLRNQGVKTAALSVSVGLYGRWYYVYTDAHNRVKNYAAGDGCYQKKNAQQMASITEVCNNPKYEDVYDSQLMNCRYVVDKKAFKTFAYDTPDTLQYKLCLSRKNVTTLKYGLTAAGLEFADADNQCGMGEFPMLTAMKKTLKFFAEKYTSPRAYEDCLSA